MLRRSLLLVAPLAVVLGTIWMLRAPASAGDDKQSEKQEETKKKPGKKVAMQAFMRKKLASSQSVLEGLALEDFDLVSKGAKELKATSAAAEFMVTNDPLYREYADEFRRVIDRMEKASKEKRIDGATLAYVDMTMSCVECHKYVRNVLVAQ